MTINKRPAISCQAAALSPGGIMLVCGLQFCRIDGPHFERRAILTRHENHRCDAPVCRKRKAFDQFFIRENALVPRRQLVIDVLERERLAECPGLFAGARVHMSHVSRTEFVRASAPLTVKLRGGGEDFSSVHIERCKHAGFALDH